MSQPAAPNGPESHIYTSPKLTYGSYLKVDELLRLQVEKSDPVHHDELLFIVSHQVYELWFKQILHELNDVCAYLDADKPLRAHQLMERIHRVQNLLIEQLPLLETMFFVEFAKFRDQLRPASGFQSVQFRKIEFTCGNKNPKMLALVGEDEAAKAEMAKFLDRPTPYDHFLRHLAREDNGVFNIPQDVLNRDTSKPHEQDDRIVEALAHVYRLQDEHPAGERYYPQMRMAEALLEFDERFGTWRYRHVKMVERMIGSMGGTGGSSGAKYLAGTVLTPFYPDLWAVRNRFGATEYGRTGR